MKKIFTGLEFYNYLRSFKRIGVFAGGEEAHMYATVDPDSLVIHQIGNKWLVEAEVLKTRRGVRGGGFDFYGETFECDIQTIEDGWGARRYTTQVVRINVGGKPTLLEIHLTS